MAQQSNVTSDEIVPEQSALVLAIEGIEQQPLSQVTQTPQTAENINQENEPLLENPSEPEGGQIESKTKIMQPEDVDLAITPDTPADADLPTDYKSVLTLFVQNN